MATRAQLQQRMAAKAEAEQVKKRQTVLWSIGGVAALVALVLIAWGAVTMFGGGEAEADTLPEDPAAIADDEAPEEYEVPDGQPVQDVFIESLAMSEPDASATAECAYTPTGDGATPDASQPAAGTQQMTIETNLGTITAEIDTANAPCTAGSFTHLAAQGYFDDSQCHRLTTQGIFVLQCGDPDARGNIEMGGQGGMGGPGYQYAEENLPEAGESNYPAGTIAMANAGPGSTGSQFFIVYADTTLGPDYTILGQITAGLDIVEDVAAAGAM
jgi:peptidyl-prolyl cis-trans isomerase B (cyclophilin B)